MKNVEGLKMAPVKCLTTKGTLELKKELHNYNKSGDQQFLDALYKSATASIEQRPLDGMIAEGEEAV